jgi:hypothetical protein
MDAEAEADGVGAKPDLQTRIDNARQQLEQFEKLLSDAYLDHMIKNFGPDWGRRQFDDHQRDFDWHLLRDFLSLTRVLDSTQSSDSLVQLTGY